MLKITHNIFIVNLKNKKIRINNKLLKREKYVQKEKIIVKNIRLFCIVSMFPDSLKEIIKIFMIQNLY